MFNLHQIEIKQLRNFLLETVSIIFMSMLKGKYLSMSKRNFADGKRNAKTNIQVDTDFHVP